MGMTVEEAIKHGQEQLEIFGGEHREFIELAIKALEQEPRKGHWIIHPKDIYAHLICDKCLSCAPYDCKTNYCPNCGAKMVEQEKT